MSQTPLNRFPFTQEIKCFCGECETENKLYECKGCKRIVPWCFGGSGQYWEYCDDCWVILSETQPQDVRQVGFDRI